MKLYSTVCLAVLALCIASAMPVAPARASHAGLSYSYSVDRFVVDRTGGGDFVDEFDDGSLAPWITSFGAPYEDTNTSGFAVLGSPGTDFYGDGFVLSERTGIVLPGQEAAGAGDFTATSEWAPVLPSFDQGYLMIVQEVTLPGTFPIVNHILLFSNTAAGLQMLQVENYDPDPGLGSDTTFSAEVFVLDASDFDASSNILLRAVYDDATGELTFSFRIDGANFISPFSPMQLTSPDVQFTLDSAAVPEPATSALVCTGAATLLAARRFGRRHPLRP